MSTANPRTLACAALFSTGLAQPAIAADQAELAKASLNPIAALISLPLQFNHDDNIGPAAKGEKWQLNVQPVIPFSLNADWNLISRTIVPLNDQDGLGAAGDASGVGDIVQSLFFSPKAPATGGWIWGAGPVMLLPTASDDALGGKKWGLGPTAVLLRQEHGWTYGALANHIWSVAGEVGRSDISATFLQPFLSYTTKTFTTFGVSTESTYDWKYEQWSVPINLTVTQMLKVGQQPITLQAGARYWAESPDAGPAGWGYRLALTFLFPK